MLNPQSPLPLYQQLAEMLRDKIRDGEYPPGSRIPSEHQLAAAHGIGRPTVRQALEVLVRRGMLVRRRGAGTFVRPQERELDLFSLAGTTAAFARRGVAVTTRMLRKIRLQRVTGQVGNPFEGDRAFFFSRLNRAAEAPVLIEDIYLDPELFAGLDKIDLAGKSLSRVVAEHYYMQPVGGRQTFRISYLKGVQAAALEVGPRTPILRVQRTLNFPQAHDAIYAELYCRTDRFVFAQEIGEMRDV
ncbi:MAG: GntR family transcriptional regulator [Desulfobacterales bacterium]